MPAPAGLSRRRLTIGSIALAALAALAALVAIRRSRIATASDAGDLRLTVYLAVEISRETAIDKDLRREAQERVDALRDIFGRIYPGVNLEAQVFSEGQLVPEIRRRTHSGLGPDLLLVFEKTANELQSRGLTDPIPFPSPLSDALDPTLLKRVQLAPDRLFALPEALQPQLACFDRSRIRRSPASLGELLRASSEGVRFGLPTDLLNLSWTLGALGALDDVAAVLEGRPVTPGMRAAIAGWLLWLRSADLQQRITLAGSQQELLAGLRNGSLDWISCRSSDVAALRGSMGKRLGLASLPAGPGGPATPISRLRVMAFGRNSSAGQRRAAEALAAFLGNPQMQRTFTLRTQEQLPVNPGVPLPVASSADLQALVNAQKQAATLEEQAVLSLPRPPGFEARVNRILTRFHLGDLDVTAATDALIETMGNRPAR
ncbi:MAG: extracellular solute-binding protein [Synechococcaceae cyanobacterium]|nr:extracellular solute-binding protein [Synechococcaceae cyanobacterium]